jgi:hypothetical protein
MSAPCLAGKEADRGRPAVRRLDRLGYKPLARRRTHRLERFSFHGRLVYSVAQQPGLGDPDACR